MTHKPSETSREFVLKAAAAKCTKEFMARHLKIDQKTLDKHYEEELRDGHELLIINAVNRLNEAAQDNKSKEGLSAAIFLSKTRFVTADAKFKADEYESSIKGLEDRIVAARAASKKVEDES